MSQIVDHLAELTGFRDRDVLDVSLVGALRDLFRPDLVTIYRCVGEGDGQRWITRARLAVGDLAATADPLWLDPEELPLLAEAPDRLACLQRQQTVVIGGPDGRCSTLFPLETDRDVAGVLEIDSAQPLDAVQLRTVNSILRVYRNFQGLLEYSERDTLTGLLNRKTFDESFMRSTVALAPVAGPHGSAAAEQRRAALPGLGWLGVIDIDHFKRVNDNHGHLIGDEVLLLLSRLMRASFRFHDQLYRFGGEEFVVLMRCVSPGDAAAAFERLRHNVESYSFPRVGRITVSTGFTQVREGDTPSGAFERADRAVYHAKQNGRNQVHSHARLVELGHLVDDSRTGDMELF